MDKVNPYKKIKIVFYTRESQPINNIYNLTTVYYKEDSKYVYQCPFPIQNQKTKPQKKYSQHSRGTTLSLYVYYKDIAWILPSGCEDNIVGLYIRYNYVYFELQGNISNPDLIKQKISPYEIQQITLIQPVRMMKEFEFLNLHNKVGKQIFNFPELGTVRITSFYDFVLYAVKGIYLYPSNYVYHTDYGDVILTIL